MSKKTAKNSSLSTSNQQYTSDPLSADELGTYFGKLNSLSRGRLNSFARGGTKNVNYKGPTNAQVRAMGGLGATQKLDIRRAQQEALDQLGADPSLSAFQKVRGQQLTNQDALQQTQALDKETEAAITALLQDRAKATTETGFRNAEQRRQDAAALAEIFFGGKGQKSSGSQTSTTTSKGSQGDNFLDSATKLFSFGF